jgi:hypothetical protein
MTNSQARVFNAVRRVQNFLDANDAVFGDVNKSATRAELNDVSSSLSASAGAQAAGKVNAQGETSNQRALRLALRIGHMHPIAAIAKLKLKTVPQFSSLVMPATNASAHIVAAAASAMAQGAQQYEQVFITAGLPPDFIAKLNTAAAAVRTSIEARSANNGQKTGATGALTAEDTRARKVIKVLNSIIVPILTADAGQSALLAEWKSIHRVTSKLGAAVGTIQAAKAAATSTSSSTATAAVTPVLADSAPPAPALNTSPISTIKPTPATEASAPA